MLILFVILFDLSPSISFMQLLEMGSRRGAGERQRHLYPGPEHDQRQGVPGALVVVLLHSPAGGAQTGLQTDTNPVLQAQIPPNQPQVPVLSTSLLINISVYFMRHFTVKSHVNAYKC